LVRRKESITYRMSGCERLAGPYITKGEAVRANGVDRKTDATVRIWLGGGE